MMNSKQRPSLTELDYSPSSREIPTAAIPSGVLRAFAVRVYRGQNFVEELSKTAGKVMRSCAPNAFILSCNGNLGLVEIEVGRATNSLHKLKNIMEKSPYEENDGHGAEDKGHVIAFEDAVQIVSLTGVFSQTFDDYNTPTVHSNLTICISDINGRVRSGQLISGFVLNSVELVLGCIEGTEFARKYSPNTDQQELYVNEFGGGGSDDEGNDDEDQSHSQYGYDDVSRSSLKKEKRTSSGKKLKSPVASDTKTGLKRVSSKKKNSSASKKEKGKKDKKREQLKRSNSATDITDVAAGTKSGEKQKAETKPKKKKHTKARRRNSSMF